MNLARPSANAKPAHWFQAATCCRRDHLSEGTCQCHGPWGLKFWIQLQTWDVQIKRQNFAAVYKPSQSIPSNFKFCCDLSNSYQGLGRPCHRAIVPRTHRHWRERICLCLCHHFDMLPLTCDARLSSLKWWMILATLGCRPHARSFTNWPSYLPPSGLAAAFFSPLIFIFLQLTQPASLTCLHRAVEFPAIDLCRPGGLSVAPPNQLGKTPQI